MKKRGVILGIHICMLFFLNCKSSHKNEERIIQNGDNHILKKIFNKYDALICEQEFTKKNDSFVANGFYK